MLGVLCAKKPNLLLHHTQPNLAHAHIHGFIHGSIIDGVQAHGQRNRRFKRLLYAIIHLKKRILHIRFVVAGYDIQLTILGYTQVRLAV